MTAASDTAGDITSVISGATTVSVAASVRGLFLLRRPVPVFLVSVDCDSSLDFLGVRAAFSGVVACCACAAFTDLVRFGFASRLGAASSSGPVKSDSIRLNNEGLACAFLPFDAVRFRAAGFGASCPTSAATLAGAADGAGASSLTTATAALSLTTGLRSTPVSGGSSSISGEIA